MSIKKFDRQGTTLKVGLRNTFTLYETTVIKNRLSSNLSSLFIDLSDCRIMDSEAIIFMIQWMKSDKHLKLQNPPAVLDEILDILELKNDWDHYYSKT